MWIRTCCYSLRAQLLCIRYVDTDKPGAESLVRNGFVIESDDAVASPDEIMRIIENQPDSSEKQTRAGTRYLNGFYDQAANDEKRLTTFERRCS